MAINLQDVIESDGDDDKFDIPDGFPGSKNPRNKPADKSGFQKPEEIKIPRRRGRPPGTGNTRSKTKSTSGVEQMWTEGAALILGIATTTFAFKVMQNKKYVMTEQEAKSAASGLIYCLFQYKTIREFALATRIDTPWAVALRGFWPYLSRVFVQDLITNVILGFNKPAKPRPTGNTGRDNNGTAPGQSNANANDNAEDGIKLPDAVILRPNWRDGD